jgi:hypothetical protein
MEIILGILLAWNVMLTVWILRLCDVARELHVRWICERQARRALRDDFEASRNVPLAELAEDDEWWQRGEAPPGIEEQTS